MKDLKEKQNILNSSDFFSDSSIQKQTTAATQLPVQKIEKSNKPVTPVEKITGNAMDISKKSINSEQTPTEQNQTTSKTKKYEEQKKAETTVNKNNTLTNSSPSEPNKTTVNQEQMVAPGTTTNVATNQESNSSPSEPNKTTVNQEQMVAPGTTTNVGTSEKSNLSVSKYNSLTEEKMVAPGTTTNVATNQNSNLAISKSDSLTEKQMVQPSNGDGFSTSTIPKYNPKISQDIILPKQETGSMDFINTGPQTVPPGTIKRLTHNDINVNPSYNPMEREESSIIKSNIPYTTANHLLEISKVPPTWRIRFG